MTTEVTTETIWREVERANFGVLGMVTAHCESRTVGIVYVVDDGKLYIGAQESAWKSRHIAHNPKVSLTVAIPRRVPFLPWIKVPATTITFSGTARIVSQDDLSDDLLARMYRHEAGVDDWCAIELTPEKDFITYGVGLSVLQMRHPELSRARAPVAAA